MYIIIIEYQQKVLHVFISLKCFQIFIEPCIGKLVNNFKRVYIAVRAKKKIPIEILSEEKVEENWPPKLPLQFIWDVLETLWSILVGVT